MNRQEISVNVKFDAGVDLPTGEPYVDDSSGGDSNALVITILRGRKLRLDRKSVV